MVGHWDKPGYSTLFKKIALVGRWAGFEYTYYLDGLGYDSHSQDCGMVGQWDKPGCCIPF